MSNGSICMPKKRATRSIRRKRVLITTIHKMPMTFMGWVHRVLHGTASVRSGCAIPSGFQATRLLICTAGAALLCFGTAVTLAGAAPWAMEWALAFPSTVTVHFLIPIPITDITHTIPGLGMIPSVVAGSIEVVLPFGVFGQTERVRPRILWPTEVENSKCIVSTLV